MLQTTLHLLEGVGVATVAVGLSPTRNARLDVVATVERRNQLVERFVLRGCMRTGPDDRHFADKDIEQLRKLIDIAVAQEASQTGHTWILSGGCSEIVAILHHGHRAEFQHANGLVVVAVPRLTK